LRASRIASTKYLLFLLPWFIGGLLFRTDTNFYNSLNLPIFAPPSIVFPIVWTILYILIAYSVYKVFDINNKTYLITLIANYIINQLFTFCFFTLKSPFLGFVDSLFTFVTAIFLYVETKSINKKNSLYLIPYLIWTGFATILSISIYFMN